jgi:hypothetical protein
MNVPALDNRRYGDWRTVKKPTRTEDEPHDRLTRICDAMSTAMESHPEYQEGDKAVVFMDSDVDRRGGLVMFGYEDDSDALASIFAHLQAVFAANGKTLSIIPIDAPGHG